MLRFARPFFISAMAALLAACASPNPITPTPSPSSTLPAPTSTPTPVLTNSRTPAVPVREDTQTLLKRLGGTPCPDSDFTCVTLTVPLDHFSPSNSQTLDVVFAVLPASGARKGLFVVATGGPGSSGIASADSYVASFDPSIAEHFDSVFFDQRGVAASGGLQCAAATAAFYRSDIRADTPEYEAATIDAARAFAQDCIREMGDAPILPVLGTRQAVEDLDAFRQAMGDGRFWLYGESYGTQFAQMYTAAHPDHVAGLILDGTVDLTLSVTDYLAQQTQAFDDVLVMTLQDCNAQPDCANDMGEDAVSVYDALAARLARSPLPYTFPLPSGGTAARDFTLADLEAAVSAHLYSESERMLMLRALAAAARDDRVPLARLLYTSLGLDPETLEAIPDPTYSDAVYYAVECNDYAYFSGTPEERAQAYIRAGDALDVSGLRLASIFYGDLPCAFWPAHADPDRPDPLVAEGVPTLVLGATADPATPVSNGEQVFHRLADGYLVTTDGGAHVIFGRGAACPDDLVTAFLVRDERPAQRETRCEGRISDDFVPLAPIEAADFANPLQAMASADDEINYSPEYWNWDQETPTSIGCPLGGTLHFEPKNGASSFTLAECAFSRGFSLTGMGEYNPDMDQFTLEVGVTGLAEGMLSYVRDGDGSIRVTGEYDGQAIDLSE